MYICFWSNNHIIIAYFFKKNLFPFLFFFRIGQLLLLDVEIHSLWIGLQYVNFNFPLSWLQVELLI